MDNTYYWNQHCADPVILTHFHLQWWKTQELPKELSKKLSGNFKNLCVDMMSGPAEFDAMQLYKAMKVSAI